MHKLYDPSTREWSLLVGDLPRYEALLLMCHRPLLREQFTNIINQIKDLNQ